MSRISKINSMSGDCVVISCYKFFFVFTVVASVILSAYSAEIVCDLPIKDFGRIKEGEKLTHTFKIQNISDKEIIVNRIVSSCGCLVSSKKRFILSPNESTAIPIEFNSMGYGGKKFEKTIVLLIKNNENEIPFKLSVRGEVEGIKIQDRIIVAPEQKTIFGEEDEEYYIFIHAPLKECLELNIKTPEYIKAQIVKIEENKVLKFTKWQIVFSLTQTIKDRLNTEIIIYTNVPFFEEVSIPVYIEPKPVVIVSPPVLFIKNTELCSLYEKEFEVTLLKSLFCMEHTTCNTINPGHSISQIGYEQNYSGLDSNQDISSFYLEPSNTCIVVDFLGISEDHRKIKYKAIIRDCETNEKLYLKLICEGQYIQEIPIVLCIKR